MTSPESRVLSAPIRSTLIGPIVAGAVWILLAVFWFSRTSWETASTSFGGFLGLTALYLFSLGFYLNIDSAGIDARWGGMHHRHNIHKWLGLVGFIFALLSPSLAAAPSPAPAP